MLESHGLAMSQERNPVIFKLSNLLWPGRYCQEHKSEPEIHSVPGVFSVVRGDKTLITIK